MVAITQAGLALYTPAFVQIAQSLNISATLVESTLTSYLLGFGVSQLVYGPLSDSFGRRKLLLAGMMIFSLGCLWAIFANHYLDLLIARLVQGLGIGACMTLSRSILRDCFQGEEYIRVASYLSSGFAIGLGLTPIIGGHLLDFFSWRSEFVFLLICGVILLILLALYLPETHTGRQQKLYFYYPG
jgi:multidrug resistance protein